MKRYPFICLMFFIIPGSVMCQVIVTDALLNNSEVFKLDRKATVTSDNMHKTSFGPFRIIDISKGKQHLIGRQTDPFLDMRGKNVNLKKSARKINAQPFSLLIAQYGADTIISNMNLTTLTGVEHALIEFKGGKPADEQTSYSYCDDMVIQIRSDSLNWRLSQYNDQFDDYSDFPLLFDGELTNGKDKIQVRGAEDFPMKKNIFGNQTQGIVFYFNRKQVAALETYPQATIWFSNTIQEHHKQVIAAVMISWLSITNPRF